MRRVFDYLQIPDDPEANRAALRWSASGDAIERPDRSLFAFASEVGLFLEGYASEGRLIHFSYVLALLQRFKSKWSAPGEPGLPANGPGRELASRSIELATAFREAGQPLRNSGALAAWLCREVPPEPDPPDPLELCLRLSNGTLMSELAVQRFATSPLGLTVETPPLGLLDFETRLLSALRQLTPVEIACWLRHGRGSLADPGERVAEAIASLKPMSLEGALASLEGRERLTGRGADGRSVGGRVDLAPETPGPSGLAQRRLRRRGDPRSARADLA